MNPRSGGLPCLPGSAIRPVIGQVAEWSKARAWKVRIRQKRIVGSNPTLSASSNPSRALRQTDRRAEWQVSWGFRGRPVDWPGAEKPENRSPEAISLRTS